MANDLYDVVLEEVSFVDAGANQHSKFTLVKRAMKTEHGKQFPMQDYAYVGDPAHPSTWKLRLTDTPGGPPAANVVGAALAALGPTGFRGRKVIIPAAALPKVKAKVLAAWKKLHPGETQVPGVLKHLAVSQDQFNEILKSFNGTGDNDMTPEELEARLSEIEKQNKDLAAANEELAKANTELTTEVTTLKASNEELKKAAETKKDGEASDDVTKGMSAEVKKAFDEQQTRLAKQDEEIAKMRDEAEARDFIAKAAAYDALPGTAEEIGKALRAVSKLPEAERDTIIKALDAGQNQLKEVDKELGTGGGGSTTGDSATEALSKHAVEISKRDKISVEQAYEKACDEHPDLFAKTREEQRQAH